MINKKMFKSAVIITAVMLSVSGCSGGCSKQAEPVIADSVVEETEPEESVESLEPTPSPTVEPTEEPVEEIPEQEENEEVVESEDSIESDESELGYEIIPMEDTTYYAIQNCNLRGGPGTDYEKVGSLSYAQEITVDGKVESGDKRWLVLKTSDGTTQMVSASLVSQTKPSTNTGSSGNGNTGNGNTGNTGNTQQPSGGNQPSGGGQQPPADDGFDPGFFGGATEAGGIASGNYDNFEIE